MARRGGVSLREAALWTVLSLASVVAGEEGCAAPTDSPTHDDRELREYERQMQQHAASESEWVSQISLPLSLPLPPPSPSSPSLLPPPPSPVSRP
eukprot:scaffold15895_cov37-Tisochrysis_lutea.AAC.1